MARDEVRYPPADADEQVAALPRRVAHAAFACLEACQGGNPSTPTEIMLFDSEVLSLAAECSALRRAIDAGLVDKWAHGIYVPTLRAHDLRSWLEERFLAETEGEEG